MLALPPGKAGLRAHTVAHGMLPALVRAAWERGLVDRVWVDETRPLLQGARLTAWELEQLVIPHAVIVDSAAASHPATPTGAEIPIEERDGAEVTARFAALNPAFDVTPASLLEAIVTEVSVHRPPYEASLPR